MVSTESPARRGRPSNDPLPQLCGEIAAVFRRAWGRGPVRTTAHWAAPNLLLVLLEDGHTDAERTLRAVGRVEELLVGRQLLGALVEGDLRATVERILTRPVEAILSASRLDPDLSAAIFLFADGEPSTER